MAAVFRRGPMLSGYHSRTAAGLASWFGTCSSVARSSSSSSSSVLRGPDFYHGRSRHVRHIFQIIPKFNGNRVFLVDTLAQVRKLEAAGIPSKHAEAITSTINEVLNDSMENVPQSFVSQRELPKENLQREIKKFKSDIEMLHCELRYEFHKEIQEIRLLAAIEAAKYDVLKFCIGGIVFLTAVGFAVVYI